jgi:hypothetical protein
VPLDPPGKYRPNSDALPNGTPDPRAFAQAFSGFAPFYSSAAAYTPGPPHAPATVYEILYDDPFSLEALGAPVHSPGIERYLGGRILDYGISNRSGVGGTFGFGTRPQGH